jgi:nicotinamidase-related amidase
MPKLIEGRAVLIVIDMQRGGGMPLEQTGIPTMAGFEERVTRVRKLVDAARRSRVPVVFFQEVHRPDHVDFGRELDGEESIHCVDGAPDTELVPELMPLPGEYLIQKRRYSCFFGTDLLILLRGLRAETLILCGALTDVCVHYTFVDAHQHDYYTRVVEDCCGGSTLARHEASLSAMEYLQRGARRSSEEIIAALEAV